MNAVRPDGTLVSGDADPTTRTESPDSIGARTSNDLSDGAGERLSRATGQSARAQLIDSNRFVEREVIGSGGMGFVMRAFDQHLRRDVAIKVLTPERAASSPDVERFVNEARITGQLEHPYIVPIYELGTDDQGQHFLCMRLVAGETLEATLDWAGATRLEPNMLADLLQIFGKICDAVSFAHSCGVIHRDLKPSNVMISDFGQVYVVDWGVARSSGIASAGERQVQAERDSDPPGTMLGTPCYMAPEQLRGLHHLIDERTDVFALGAILYKILTGRPPLAAADLAAIRRGHAKVSVLPPEQLIDDLNLPAELSRIALKAMSHEKDDRYPSVSELKSDVERFQRGAWHLPQVRFAAGAPVVHQGDVGDSAFIIVKGQCVAYRTDGGGNEIILRQMGPGDVFGETAVLSHKPRTASVRALTDLVVMVVTADILSNALGLNFWMGSFVRALADRFCELDERLRELEKGTSRRFESS
jgi:CRP-like cAMP-binding protein